MSQQDTNRPARRMGHAGKVSAARITAAAFGIGAGLLGLEHGFFETQHGSATPGGLVIHAIGPPCQPHTAWHGCEPTLTVIPSFAATGVTAMLLAAAVLIWAAGFVTRPHGGLILLVLVVALFLAGGGFTTFWFGLLAEIAATQITAPSTRWRTWLGSRLTRLLARLWPSLFVAYLAWAAGSWIVAAISNAVMLRLTPAVTAATPIVLALILLSALTHDSQQGQAASSNREAPRQNQATSTWRSNVAKIEGEILIGRPVEEVFDFVADQRNEPHYNPRMVRAAKITNGPVGKGTVFQSATKSMGRTAEMRIELTGYNRPARLASRTIMRQADTDGTLTFEPAPSGTRMRWSWHVQPRGAVRLLAPLITWMGSRQEQTVWASMKRYLENTAARPTP